MIEVVRPTEPTAFVATSSSVSSGESAAAELARSSRPATLAWRRRMARRASGAPPRLTFRLPFAESFDRVSIWKLGRWICRCLVFRDCATTMLALLAHAAAAVVGNRFLVFGGWTGLKERGLFEAVVPAVLAYHRAEKRELVPTVDSQLIESLCALFFLGGCLGLCAALVRLGLGLGLGLGFGLGLGLGFGLELAFGFGLG